MQRSLLAFQKCSVYLDYFAKGSPTEWVLRLLHTFLPSDVISDSHFKIWRHWGYVNVSTKWCPVGADLQSRTAGADEDAVIHTRYKFQGDFILDLLEPGPAKWPQPSNCSTFIALPMYSWFNFIQQESSLSALRYERNILSENDEISFKSMLLIWTEALMQTKP